jgi:hypothetical protein
MLNPDYKEMLECLSEERVRFLLVGAYALAVYGYPRATKDIDFFVRASPENASSLMRALSRFGAPLKGISESDFASEGIVFQIGSSTPKRSQRRTSAHAPGDGESVIRLRAVANSSPRL